MEGDIKCELIGGGINIQNMGLETTMRTILVRS